MRFLGALAVYSVQDKVDLIAPPPITAGSVKIQAIKFWADGSTQGFTAAVQEPYLNAATNGSGALNYKTEDLYSLMGAWLKKGWQLIVHSNGDAATAQVLGIYEDLFAAHRERDMCLMHRIEHFTVTTPEQVKHAARLGLGVGQTIGHVYYWGQTFRDWVLGPKRAARIDPIREDAEAGLVFSLHSDSPVTNLDPLLYLRTAVTRQMYGSEEVLGPEQRVDLQTALRGVTTNAAAHCAMGNVIGSLEVGKSADFVILEKDPREVDAVDLHLIGVSETWFQGRRTWPKAA